MREIVAAGLSAPHPAAWPSCPGTNLCRTGWTTGDDLTIRTLWGEMAYRLYRLGGPDA